METQINGHVNRTIRANKLWEKWWFLQMEKNMMVKDIARKFLKKNGKPYNPRYVSRILSKLRKIKNHSLT